MNKKFIKVSLGILIFLSISLLSFTLIFDKKKADYQGYIDVPKVSISYSGFEEEEDKYKIKVSIKNNSEYYGSIRDIKLKFQTNSNYESYTNSGPIFGSYDLKEREYFENYKEGERENYSTFFDPMERRDYIFEIPKGLSFDKKVFDTNRMKISYNIEYFKRRIKNGVAGRINMQGSEEIIDNSVDPYVIE
ncbi:hypothetical protein R0131_14040 [Clostridium sp. AL.422]|uniref:hypothetical protein n=1 Tax=Clostridium TaxID=1485 RepID=UPI00293DE65B|nr:MULTISPECIES: hypothetical protein [unclassified Clostridium]MDV4151944.1 hypothetical protein [Clostridium sp. AL.422]